MEVGQHLNIETISSTPQFSGCGNHMLARILIHITFNFKIMESRLSTHRGCQACNRRPSVG